MYTFRFVYFDKSYQDFSHIVRAKYRLPMMDILVAEDKLLAHEYPVGTDIHLYSEAKSYTASGKNVKYIEVTKEGI